MNRHVLFCDSLAFWGGGEHWIVAVARALAARGWRTTVAGRDGSELLRRARAAGIETVAWPYHRDFDWATMSAAAGFLQRQAPDLVLVTTGRDIRTAGLAARWRGLPVVWRMGLMPKDKWIHRLTCTWVITRIIAPSEYVHRQIESLHWLQGRTTVIPNGVPDITAPSLEDVQAARTRLGVAADERIILYVGRLLPAKGVDVLVRAFGPPAAASPDVRLIMVGTGPEEETLHGLASESGIADRITFAGFTDDPSDYFTACDLLVLPSRFETFGFVLLEAMARAKPIVATRVGGVPEVTGDDSALLVGADDPNALSEAMSTLLRDHEMCRTLGRSGQQRMRALFSESRMVDRVEELFLSVITSGGASHGNAVPLESRSSAV
ncbi:MAG TPA: glycosyltransferase family 4 protein [Acidobacteriota bacterium]|nr:glycosyltransferase family 4 protein [Acidobacteriota bacterium]